MALRALLIVGALFPLCLAMGISAADTDRAITIQATRHDARGAIVLVPSIVGPNGSVQPAPAMLGEGLIVNGTALPPNQPVQAFLVTPTQTFPLTYLGPITPSATPVGSPITDAYGTLQNAAFQLPSPGAVTERNAQVIVIVQDGSGDGEIVPASTSIVFG